MDKQADQLTPELVNLLRKSQTASQEEIFQLLLSPQQAVLQTLLKNPRFNEDHLLALLKRRDLNEEFIEHIYRRQKSSPSHRTQLAIARNPSCPSHLLRTLLQQLRLFELLDICFIPGGTADQKIAAERLIIQRLPTTPLGNKITLARRGTSNIVGEIIKEAQAQLMEACLTNPHLKEAAIFQYLRSSRACAEGISMIARHERWKMRPNLRLTILKNRKTPEIWYTLWLPQQNLVNLRQLLGHFRQHPARKNLIEKELLKRGSR